MLMYKGLTPAMSVSKVKVNKVKGSISETWINGRPMVNSPTLKNPGAIVPMPEIMAGAKAPA